MPSELVALFDMDGTLFDYDGQLREDLATLMSPNETMPEDIFDESIPWLKARMHLIKSQPGWWRELPKLQLGWDVYHVAVELGFCIDILTKGPRSKPQAWAEKVECIMRHFGDEVVPISSVRRKNGTTELSYAMITHLMSKSGSSIDREDWSLCQPIITTKTSHIRMRSVTMGPT